MRVQLVFRKANKLYFFALLDQLNDIVANLIRQLVSIKIETDQIVCLVGNNFS